jgi:PAS domain S-box-containing protein
MSHKLLDRQLRKIALGEDHPPTLEQWQKFLERVNRVYMDSDQERYCLERSLMISSREMQEIHERLSKSETRYALAAKGTNDGLWDWDLISDEAYYSERWIEMMRVEKGSAEIVCSRQCWLQKIHAEDKACVESEIDAHLRGETEHFENEHRVVLADGNQLWIRVLGLAVFDENGKAIRLAGSMRDITIQKQVEIELKEAKEFLACIIENLPCFIAVKDYSGRFVMVNKMLADIFQRPVSEIIGRSDEDLITSGDFSDEVRLDDLEVLDGRKEITRSEKQSRDENDNPIWWEITRRGFYVDNEERPNLLSIGVDVTERKMMEAHFAQSQKLESVGQLAAGIAHEINTPTQYVGDNTRFIQDSFGDILAALDEYESLLKAARNDSISSDLLKQVEEKIAEADIEYLREEFPKAIRQTLDGVDRISRIVQSMRAFAHPETGVKMAIDINKAIESTITVARNEWKYIADLETDYAADLPLVPCFVSEFNQVVLNMIINATHAIADVVGDGSQGKGRIVISTSVAGKWAEIRIADSGAGIPQNIQNRIFDPFFTTKEVGKGTGQGLAISHTVITEKHGGAISFETAQGKGTTFIVRLPLNPENGSTTQK